MLHIDIGLSAIRANQSALHTISNNIANANTAGFHRQRADLAARPAVTSDNLNIGTGVDVATITRLQDRASEVALTTTTSLHNQSSAHLDILRQIETALLPSEGSLTAAVTDFFNQIEQLAAQPDTLTIRNSIVATAQQILGQIQHLDNRLSQLSRENSQTIIDDVQQTNQIAQALSEITAEIELQQNQGRDPNTLLDQRDRLISRLSELVDISPISLLTTGSPVIAAGGGLTIAAQSTQLDTVSDQNGQVRIQSQFGNAVVPTAGSLAGRLEAQTTIDSIRLSLHDWVNTFVAEIDHIQATGLGQHEQSQTHFGTRSISDPTLPLAALDSPFPVQPGSLFITLTDLTNQTRQTFEFDVNPATDSLNDVLTRLNALPDLSAQFNSATGTVTIAAAAGDSLDFAGGIDPLPTASTLTGTSHPRLSGRPTGSGNRSFTATVVTSGTVGATSGLQLELTDSSTGEVVGLINVGDTYEPGSRIDLPFGASLSLSAGTLNAGETFDFRVIDEPDESRLLTLLGIHTFFQGDAEHGISVNRDLAHNSLNLATSQTGSVGDASHLTDYMTARNSRRFANNQENFEERLNSLTVATGYRIQVEESGLAYLDHQQQQLESTRDSVSGVDPNEELLLMLEYQRAFQAASRFVSTVDATLDDLLNLIR